MPTKNNELDARIEKLAEEHGLREEYVFVWKDNTIHLDGNFTHEFLKDLAALL